MGLRAGSITLAVEDGPDCGRRSQTLYLRLVAALQPEDVVLGGGNIKKLKKPPSGLPRGRERQCIPGRVSPLAGNERGRFLQFRKGSSSCQRED